MMDKGFGYWFTGFTDGEGHFRLHLYKSAKEKWVRIKVAFVIKARADNADLLQKIKEMLGVGKVYYQAASLSQGRHNRRAAFYSVVPIAELHKVIIPMFEQFPLRGKKNKEFQLWKTGVEIMHKVHQRSPRIRYTEEEKRTLEKIGKQLTSLRHTKETNNPFL